MMLCVTLPYDPDWLALAWAKEHCPSYTTNESRRGFYTRYDTVIHYYFYDKRDAFLFALRWS
jgi:hypothetical protein